LVEDTVLLMAYGTPSSEAEIIPYLADIRHGRPARPEIVEELKQRYRKIGGRSPLLEITNAQASALQKQLNANRKGAKVHVGMKHWHPYIHEVVPQILRDNPNRIVALVLAPHYSEISIGRYRQALDEALSNSSVQVDFVESWYDNPLFHQAVAEKVRDALRKFPASANVEVVFTAHSLPERILELNDPYPNQFLASSRAVANLVGVREWSFAYQSAGMTDVKWLGPDILEKLEAYSAGKNVLVVPIGFVADHLEILYDIDVEAQEFAKAQGLRLIRSESLNTSPTFIQALADVVKRRL
jgi:ferrochelatase